MSGGRAGFRRLLTAAILAAACTDTSGPSWRGVRGPLLAVGLDSDGGTMASGPTPIMAKGFNGPFKNPRPGSAVVATFMWTGPSNVITSVGARLANGRRFDHTYQLVESVSNGTLSMATYLLTNVQGHPYPCCAEPNPSDPDGNQDSVYVVEAFLSQTVTQQGVIISSYAGVDTSFTAAFGPHSSATGTGPTVAPGPVSADSGSLVYGVAIASPPAGHTGPGAPFQLVGSGANNSSEADARWAEAPSTGAINPTWDWFYGPGTGSWLASSIVLNAEGGAPPTSPPPPPPGDLAVTTSTSGSSLDADGYTVAVDGGAGQAIAINSNVTYTGLSAGNHTVEISGVAGNCTVSGGNPRTISVPSGGTASTTFSVSCSTSPGHLAVTTSTSGSSLDPDGYAVAVDGGAGQAIGTNDSFTFTDLSAGNHSVALSGVAGNCTVSGGNPRTVSVPSGGTANTTFSVSCSTSPGNLTANTSTTGSSLDPDGYAVSVDGGPGQPIGINSSVTFTNLPAGNHGVALSGVAGNCTVSGSNPRTISVPSGGTASTTFSVSCSAGPVQQILLVEWNGTLGQSGTELGKEFNPRNPPNGSTIVATFVWQGSTNVIANVTDYLWTGAVVGNTYNLVDYVTLNGISMATYVAVNVQNVPYPKPDEGAELIVRATLSTPVSSGGVVIAAYSGVHPDPAQALGQHRWAVGFDAIGVAQPGTITVNPGALVYATSMVSHGTVGMDPPPGFTKIGTGSDSWAQIDAEYLIQAAAGSVNPRWAWTFTSPETWLAAVVALNPAPQ